MSAMEHFDAIDPSTRRPFARIPEASEADVDRVVRAAAGALADATDWRVPQRRAEALSAFARAIEGAADALADLERADTGKPMAQARADVGATVRYYDYYAGAADKLEGSSIPLGPGYVDYTVHEPWGVCGQIIPWNYPMQVMARCSAPALAAGNAVVVKPSESGSVTPLRLAALALDAGIPAGILQVVTGHGPAGAALVRHPLVSHVTFVGSARTGAAVAHACADRLIPVQLELGGKSPNVVFADADLERAVPAIVKALVQNAGQSCSAGTRVLIERSRYDEVVERLSVALRSLRWGPSDADLDLGPLISAAQIERAEGMLERAAAQGASIVTGGGRPDGHAEEWFLEPTLILDADPGSEIVNEEVFGPVLAGLAFDDEAEAIRLANASPYGLVAGVWTQDVGRAHRVASAIQAGQVYVNTYGVAGGVELPFGGMKQSGYGRGKGLEALRSYSQIKNVCVAL